MEIKFSKLIFKNRFSNSFENWDKNNNLQFSSKGFVNVYAPNGVGKSSFATALKNEKGAEYTYEYDGKKYTEKSKDNPILVIDDFFFRNIASRENEKISDYILGSKIKEELELQEKIQSISGDIKNKIKEYLKREYKINTKSSNLCSLLDGKKDKAFIEFVSDIANKNSNGKKYDSEKILELISNFEIQNEKINKDEKFDYVKNHLEDKNCIINSIINFNTSDFSRVEKIEKIDINNDAIKILEKHKSLTKCIFEETHSLPTDLKEKLEKNKESILNQLNNEQKNIINEIFQLDSSDPFEIKEVFNFCFETGKVEKINELINEIKENVLKIKEDIMIYITKLVKENKLKELVFKLNELLEEKIKLTEADEILLKEIIKNCLNKEVTFERDENNNIIFKIDKKEIIGKSRQELPLSTGEQNFISLYFELLAAKNSKKEVVIIDDPISSFDSIYKNKIIYAINKILDNKNTIILTHNISTIKLMQRQHSNCFNLYLLNNEDENQNVNGFTKIEGGKNKDLDLLLEIKNVIDLFSNEEFITNDIKEEEQFLMSIIPFMRSYLNLLHNKDSNYENLCKLMHGYENEKIDVNAGYIECFGRDVTKKYIFNVSDILNVEIKEEIVDKNKYPLLNRTLYHTLSYLKLRLLVEKTLVDFDSSNIINSGKIYQLNQIINKCLKNNPEERASLLSKKTLLNEFNHFEYDMCLFMPSLDISDTKLKEEKDSIIEICDNLKSST